MPTTYNSTATLDAIGFTLPIDREALGALLEPLSLRLAPANDVARGKHPVCFELWRVQGALIVGGVEQRQWFERAGATASALAAGPVAAAVGALRGAAEGGRAGARFGPLGAAWGAYAGFWGGGVAGLSEIEAGGGDSAGARIGRAWSGALSRSLGHYQELLLGVPGVMRQDDPALHMLVLGMRSDGAISLWGDRWLGTGYRKQPARIERRGSESFSVWDARSAPSRRPGLRARFTFEAARASPELSRIRAHWQQPLLGVVERAGEPARLVVTRLERDLASPDVRWSALRGSLELAAGFAPEIAAGTFELAPLSAAEPLGAFHVTPLRVRLAYPDLQ